MNANTQVRAGCYLRISSDPKDKREGVERQREDTAALCELKGWTVAGIYPDNDRSASSGKERPEWNRLLADIEAGKIDAVAAWDQDRGWRMMSELENLRARLDAITDRRVLLATTGQGDVDLYSPAGILTAQVKTAVSEHEVRMMSVRQRRAARQRAERGIARWPQNPFGYTKGTHTEACPRNCELSHIEINEAQAELVRQAYAALIGGAKLRECAAIFNDRKAYGFKGVPWSPTTVSLFLNSPRNAGIRAHNREIVLDADGKPVRGNWPALIDMDTWNKAQAVFSSPDRRRPGPRSVNRHRFTGLLRCGKCGTSMGGQWTLQKTRAYQCKSCRGVSIRAEHVEPLLLETLIRRLSRDDAIDLLRNDGPDDEETKALRAEAEKLTDRLDEIADERADGLLTGAQAHRASARIQARLDEIEHRQRDADRVQVFEDLDLGTPKVAAQIKALPEDRLRACIEVLGMPVIEPVGKGGNAFNPDRVRFDWR
ncbi:recombinase family protein [Mycobacterium sp. 20091114027_K0903767]|nr:recombinase family protein [Mycobacterium sp. 20091114027_K0903767]